MFLPFYHTYFVYLFPVVYGIPSINSSRYFIAPRPFAIQTLRWDTYQLLHYTIHSHYLAFVSRYILLYIAVCRTNTELSCLEYYINSILFLSTTSCLTFWSFFVPWCLFIILCLHMWNIFCMWFSLCLATSFPSLPLPCLVIFLLLSLSLWLLHMSPTLYIISYSPVLVL